ncbi:cyclin-I [Electrophorus electricus]|uniref:Cyclin-I n=1 Tax=Electrophorus electricus TaxID=8005 RepID=A0A4W4EA49_ELEEL|nr:cyclin-I [Electrophorus electricus]
MKFAEPLEGRKLHFRLEQAASREARLWKARVPKKPSSQDADISPGQRDEAVRWLADVHRRLQLYPETICLAVSILDRFLATVKARPKYLRCIAITCFFLAAKTSEEDERLPTLRELISSSSCGCTRSEMLRMERIILDKLSWDLHTATPLTFLHIFHAMVFSCKAVHFNSGLSGLNRSQHLALLTQELLHCISHSALLHVRGSMLALALVTLQLEKLCPDWLALTVDLLQKTQIDSSELIGCRELVARCLSTHTASLPPNTVYICLPPRPSPFSDPHPEHRQRPALPAWHLSAVPPSGAALCTSLALRRKPSAKRKVEQMDVDEYFDGIKRLYNEDSPPEGVPWGGDEPAGGGASSGSVLLVARPERGSPPCPALQPVTVS